MENNPNICEKIKENLSAFLDQELSEEAMEAIQQHLDQCELCRSEYTLLKSLSGQLQDFLTSVELDIPDLSVGVFNKLNNDRSIDCNNIDEMLSAYYDGELETEEYYLIDEHIKECSDCNKKYQQLVTLRKLVAMSVNSLEIDLWNGVYTRLMSDNDLKCEFVFKEISAYLDKEIDKDLHINISAHIMKCVDCRKYYDEQKNFQKTLQTALLQTAEGIDLWPKLLYRITEENRKKMFAVSAVATMLVAVIVWNLLSVIFPANESSLEMVYKQKLNQNPSKFTTDKADYIVDAPSSADNYLFSSTLDSPPSEILPIIYYNNGSDYYGD